MQVILENEDAIWEVKDHWQADWENENSIQDAFITAQLFDDLRFILRPGNMGTAWFRKPQRFWWVRKVNVTNVSFAEITQEEGIEMMNIAASIAEVLEGSFAAWRVIYAQRAEYNRQTGLMEFREWQEECFQPIEWDIAYEETEDVITEPPYKRIYSWPDGREIGTTRNARHNNNLFSLVHHTPF